MLHILLVDDDEDEHLFFQWSVEKMQTAVQLSCVFTGAQAFEFLSAKKPDIIFVDINIPGADGFDCLDAIRKVKHLQDVPVYMYSTEINETGQQKAAELGGSGCVKKMRNHELLTRIISEKLNLAGAGASIKIAD